MDIVYISHKLSIIHLNMSKFLRAMEGVSPSFVNRSEDVNAESTNPDPKPNPNSNSPSISQPKLEEKNNLNSNEKMSVVNVEEKKEEQQQPREELLTVLLDIGNNKEEQIIIYEGDKAETIAENFVIKHNMDDKMKDKLKKHIQENIDKVMIEIALEESNNSIGRAQEKINEVNLIHQENNNKVPTVLRQNIGEGQIRTLPIHQRLHMQAITKQRALKHSHDYCKFNYNNRYIK